MENQEILSGVKNIIAVSSGKGGVGKSTVAVNLAVTLAKKGYKVGLVDADIYGPSLPTMFDLEHSQPEVIESNGKNLVLPIEKYGVKVLSIGFFVKPEQAVLWRGPMASGALKQLFTEAEWGDLDYLMIDMPPGTGDIHLTLVQTVPITGAVIVTTPQKVALADARKGVAMFRNPNVKVPVLGVIENMAYFVPEELPDNRYYIFGKEGARNLAEELTIPFIGEVPIVQGLREGGDTGLPLTTDTSNPVSDAFDTLCDNLLTQVDIRNTLMGPTRIVQVDANTKGCGHKH